MARLKQLNFLRLSNNRIGSMPLFGLLPMPLKWVYLDNNRIESIPPTLSKQNSPFKFGSPFSHHHLPLTGYLNASLEIIVLDKNPLNSIVPDWLFNRSFTSLLILSLSGCGLSGHLPNEVNIPYNVSLFVRSWLPSSQICNG